MILSKRLVERIEDLFDLEVFRDVIKKFVLSLSFADRLQLIIETRNHRLADFLIDKLSTKEREAEDKAIRAVLVAREREENF